MTKKKKTNIKFCNIYQFLTNFLNINTKYINYIYNLKKKITIY